MLNTRPIAKCFLSIIAAVAVAASAVAGDAPSSSAKKRPVKQPQSEVQKAVWVTKVSSFVYRDLTSKFTCKALESQIKDVLQLLGASKSNLTVTTISCPEPLTPAYFPGANITMSVLQPAVKATPPALTVPVRWKTVDLKLGPGGKNDSSQCQLLDAIAKNIVPLFTTRNLEARTNCTSPTASTAEPILKVDVLTADEPRPNS